MTKDEPGRPDWDDFFAQNLRATREAMGLTQVDLAERMRERGFSFHQATVYKIEKGERKVSIGEAKALAGMFDMSLDKLADEPSRPRDAEFFASVLWERSNNMIEALGDIWSASERFVNQQEALVGLLGRLLDRDAQGEQGFSDLPEDDYREHLEASVASMYAPAAANSTVQEFRDRLIRDCFHGDFYEIIANISGWPGDMPDDPTLDEDMYPTWAARREALLARWRRSADGTDG